MYTMYTFSQRLFYIVRSLEYIYIYMYVWHWLKMAKVLRRGENRRRSMMLEATYLLEVASV